MIPKMPFTSSSRVFPSVVGDRIILDKRQNVTRKGMQPLFQLFGSLDIVPSNDIGPEQSVPQIVEHVGHQNVSLEEVQ
jgi:hypothetical protein